MLEGRQQQRWATRLRGRLPAILPRRRLDARVDQRQRVLVAVVHALRTRHDEAVRHGASQSGRGRSDCRGVTKAGQHRGVVREGQAGPDEGPRQGLTDARGWHRLVCTDTVIGPVEKR